MVRGIILRTTNSFGVRVTMSENIYATPSAEISEVGTDTPRYYVVSVTKFVVLSILTMDLYLIYWMWRNWRNVKQAEDSDIWPIPRAIFLVFFMHVLLDDVRQTLKEKQSSHKWAPMLIATIAILCIIISNAMSRFSDDLSMLDVVALGLGVVTAFVLAPAQRAINVACDDPGGRSNAGFTVWNWLWIIPFALVWLLTLFGLYALFFAPELLVE